MTTTTGLSADLRPPARSSVELAPARSCSTMASAASSGSADTVRGGVRSVSAPVSETIRSRTGASGSGPGRVRARGRYGRRCSTRVGERRSEGTVEMVATSRSRAASTAASGARRSSAMPPSRESTAGARTRSRSRRPKSRRRSARTSPGPPASSATRPSAWRAPSRAARWAGTAPEPRSTEWTPHTTTSQPARAGVERGGDVVAGPVRQQLHPDRLVGPGGEGLAQHGLGRGGPSGDRHDAATPGVGEPQRPLERAAVGLGGVEEALVVVDLTGEGVDLGALVGPLQAGGEAHGALSCGGTRRRARPRGRTR